MLIGEYSHTIDAKKRMALPSRFRKELGKKIVLTRGLDKCLFVYPMAEWAKVLEKLSANSIGQANSRGFNRFILAGAVETEVDSLGRILVPDFLKEFANLKEKVIVAGVHPRAEIWDDEAWTAYKSDIGKQADSLAQALGEIGVI